MVRELDSRHIPETTSSAELLSAASARAIFPPGTETAPEPEPELIERALDETYARFQAPRLEITATAYVPRTSTGERIVHLAQQVRGVPVFQGAMQVHFAADGEPMELRGSPQPADRLVDLRPRISAGAAAAAAGRHVTEGSDRQPTRTPARVLTSFPLPSRPAVLRKRGIRGLIRTHLTLFLRHGETLLAWHVVLDDPATATAYALLISATDGSVLYCRGRDDDARARGPVYRTNPGDQPVPEAVAFPRPLADLPTAADLPAPPPGFPGEWGWPIGWWGVIRSGIPCATPKAGPWRRAWAIISPSPSRATTCHRKPSAPPSAGRLAGPGRRISQVGLLAIPGGERRSRVVQRL